MHRVYLNYLGHWIEVPEGDSIVGRAFSCLLRFNDSSISRQHCRLRVHGDRVTITDLGSSNGTFVNGERIASSTELRRSDLIRVGNRQFTVMISIGEDPAEKTSPEFLVPPVEHLREARRSCPDCRGRVPLSDDSCPQCGRVERLNLVHTTQKLPLRELSSAERRRHARHRVHVPVIYSSEHQTLETIASSLSRGGAFVPSDEPDPLRTECEVTILADGAPAITLTAWVVSAIDDPTRGPLGMGIEFIHLRPVEVRWLDDLIIRLGTPG